MPHLHHEPSRDNGRRLIELAAAAVAFAGLLAALWLPGVAEAAPAACTAVAAVAR